MPRGKEKKYAAKQLAGLAMMRFNELGDWYDELFQRGMTEVDFVYW